MLLMYITKNVSFPYKAVRDGERRKKGGAWIDFSSLPAGWQAGICTWMAPNQWFSLILMAVLWISATVVFPYYVQPNTPEVIALVLSIVPLVSLFYFICLGIFGDDTKSKR